MSYVEIETTYIRVEPSGFDTRQRYIRKSAGGSIVFSGGRTIRTYGNTKRYISSTTEFNWTPFRVNLGNLTVVCESMTYNGQTDTAAVAAVNPVLETCKI